jgi:phosphoglycolate phosphatase
MSKKLLVCDLDNTLYDWIGYFVPSFYEMVDVVVEITGCDREKLLDDFHKVHQSMHDSEQPFALLKTETIKRLYADVPTETVMKILDPAFHAFNSARKRNLRLYPGVKETLEILNRAGIGLIAHTESKLFGVVDRLRRLDLSRFFAKIYCRERSNSSHPAPQSVAKWFDDFPMDKVIELSHHQAKPNPSVLLEICSNEGISHIDTAYIGDSIARDVLMAKRAGVFAIWAAYGAKHDAAMYDALVRISHWTPEEVARERRLKEEARTIEPDYSAHRSFAEVLRPLGLRMIEAASRP